MTHTDITPDFISQLKLENATDDLLKQLLEISQNNPDDLLRGFARAWLQNNAIPLLKKFY